MDLYYLDYIESIGVGLGTRVGIILYYYIIDLEVYSFLSVVSLYHLVYYILYYMLLVVVSMVSMGILLCYYGLLYIGSIIWNY